jgi:hypothetical protein
MRVTVPFFTLVVASLFALALGLLSIAAMPIDAEGPAEHRLAQANLVSGVVASVDPANLILIMRTRFGQAQGFPVSSAELLKGINQGDAITVELDAEGVARRITKTAVPSPDRR